MAKTKISEYSSTANSNTDIASINIDEGCAPSGINNAIRALMAQLKDWQSGAQDVYITPAGSVSAPAVTTNGDTNTGVYFPAADKIALATGGTQAVIVDASQNVGIGTSSPTSGMKTDIAGYVGSSFNGASNDSVVGSYSFINTNASASANPVRATIAGGRENSAWGAYLAFSTSTGTAAATEKMRIDSSGNVGIGTSSPSGALGLYRGASTSCMIEIAGNANTPGSTSMLVGQDATSSGYCWNRANSVLLFGTNNTERMRIDSSGNLLVGTTSGSWSQFVKAAGNNYPLAIQNTSDQSGASGFLITLGTSNTNNTSSQYLVCYNGSSIKALIYGNGNMVNTNGSYGTYSDLKLKENITDATPKLAKLNQVRVVNYTLKSDPTQKNLGVIAQELEQIFPGMVDESPDKDADGNDLGTTTKSVKYSVFVPMLIKAMQEQQAIIEGLTARITALESK